MSYSQILRFLALERAQALENAQSARRTVLSFSAFNVLSTRIFSRAVSTKDLKSQRQRVRLIIPM